MTSPADNDPAVQARTEAAEALTQFLTKTADAIDAERHKFPAASSMPRPLDVDPGVISDFTTSAAYKQAVEDYIFGRAEQNLLVTALQMLRGLRPGIFGGI